MEQQQSREKVTSRTAVVALRPGTQHDARRFLCSSHTWAFLRDLGQTFGWHPRGTTYVTSVRQKPQAPASIRHNYQPGGMHDYKRIEAADALEWAIALGVARQSSYLGAMVRAHIALAGSSEESLLSTLDEFIRFARDGAFSFALCGESDDHLRSN
jgi:hypothetical protein